jgi:ubiquinone/menaquinone biosynthesis C-methylase UbiE
MAHPQNAAAEGPLAIFQMLHGAQSTAVLCAAIELGAFAALGDGPLDSGALAERIKCPARSTRILLNALAVLGMVEKKGSTYKLAPLAEQHLVPGRPAYFGDMAGIIGSDVMWTGLSRFADAVRHDGSILERHAETPKHPFWETFARASRPIALAGSAALEELVLEFVRSRKGPRMLDVASGSGIYSYSMVKNHPNLEATLLDWPNVLAESKSWADKLGADPKRVRYLEGDLFSTEFGGPYDLVLMSNIFHHFDRPTCLALARKAAGAVQPGGKLVVQEFLTDDDDRSGVMFSVTMLAWTRKGEAYGAADYTKWFAEAGFGATTVHRMPGMPTAFLVADR